MNLFGLFKHQVVVTNRDPLNLRLHEWRSDKGLVGAAQKMFGMSEFRWCMDVLRNEHPAFTALPTDCPPHVRMARQAQAEGYEMALNNLAALAKFEQPREPLEATFGTEMKE